MKAPTNAQQATNIVPRFAEMTPYQVYLQQVRGTTENVRSRAMNLDYIPPQFGGLIGQLQTISEEIVLQLIDFSVGDNSK